MRKIFKGVTTVVLLLGAVYLMGPRVETPILDPAMPQVPQELSSLATYVENNEAALPNIKPGNQAVLHFYDSIPQKTKYAILYYHGFTASPVEGDPVYKDIAQALGANLFVPRLYGHGLEEEEPMLNFHNDPYWESAKEALAIAKTLGEKVIILATSHGSTLALSLGEDPQVAAVALYSPNIRLADPAAVVLSKPWGIQLARLVKGGNYHEMDRLTEAKKKFWTYITRLESGAHLQKFLEVKMQPETFAAFTKPLFMGYYYKDEQNKDEVVSIPALLAMYEQLGTPDSLKQKMTFPEAGEHVMTCYLSTKNYDQVTKATLDFLNRILSQNEK